MSTSLLGGSRSSEAKEESEVDEGEGRGVSAGDISAEDATLLEVVEVVEVVEVASGCIAAVNGNAVEDMCKEEIEGFQNPGTLFGSIKGTGLRSNCRCGGIFW